MKLCLECKNEFASDGWECARCGYTPKPGRFPNFLDGTSSIDYVVDAYDDSRWLKFEAANAFWFRPRARLIATLIRGHFGSPGSFLEVGCGAGGVLEQLATSFPAMSLTGGEPASAGLSIAATRAPSAQLMTLDAMRLPFRDEFDVIGSFDVIEHLEDDHGAIREMSAALKPGGGLVLTVPQHPRLWSRYDEAGGHHRRYTRGGLVAVLEGEGFRVERCTSFVTSLLPAVAWSRYRADRAHDYDVVAFDSGVKPGSKLLEWVLEREVDLVERGVNLPVGSSLAVVARRG